jgi:hypothetical protein
MIQQVTVLQFNFSYVITLRFSRIFLKAYFLWFQSILLLVPFGAEKQTNKKSEFNNLILGMEADQIRFSLIIFQSGTELTS